MNIVRLAIRQLASRPLQTGLNILLLAIGLGTVALLMLFDAQMQQRLLANANGIDLVVGAKGSPLQLILSTVYHADIPTGNIPKREADKLKSHPLVANTIPLALGDNLAGFRIVGTSTDYPALYGGKLKEGRWWSVSMEAVLGANVAAKTGLKLGQEVASNHGLGGGGHSHDDNLFQVVGILEPTNTVLDDLVLTGPDSVWDLHEDHGSTNPAFAKRLDGEEEDGKPRDLTALLIQYKTPLAVLALPRQINAQTSMQAASPALESARLLGIVGFGLDAFRAFAAILIASAALSLFVALYGALKERRFDLAVMRLLGSSRLRLLSAVLLEGVLLALASSAAGLLLGHAVLEWAGRAQLVPGMRLTGFFWVAEEAWLVLVALATGLVAALIPAIQAYRTDIATVLSER